MPAPVPGERAPLRGRGEGRGERAARSLRRAREGVGRGQVPGGEALRGRAREALGVQKAYQSVIKLLACPCSSPLLLLHSLITLISSQRSPLLCALFNTTPPRNLGPDFPLFRGDKRRALREFGEGSSGRRRFAKDYLNASEEGQTASDRGLHFVKTLLSVAREREDENSPRKVERDHHHA